MAMKKKGLTSVMCAAGEYTESWERELLVTGCLVDSNLLLAYIQCDRQYFNLGFYEKV